MNLSFEEASHGFIQCAAWVGQEQAGQQVVGIFQHLRVSYPQIAGQLAALMIQTYSGILTKHGKRITAEGYTLPGYVAPVAVALEPLSDGAILRILRPLYDEFIASHAG